MSNILHDQANLEISLMELIKRFDSGKLQLPEHQRGSRWNHRKVARWVSRVTGRHINGIDHSYYPTKIIGIFLTYQTTQDDVSPIYLNDGSQRLRASIEYLNNPTKFGDTPEQAEAYLEACLVSVQHRHYPTEYEAIKDFQLINFGTHLTPYEFCKGIFTYMPQYKTVWQPLLDDLHAVVHENAQLVVRKPNSRAVITMQKHYRNDYAMFFRYITQQKLVGRDPKVGATRVPYTDIEEGRVIEARLKDAIEKAGPKKARQQLESFSELVNAKTNDIESVWQEITQENTSEGITYTNYRWLLEVGIWQEINKIAASKWLDFLKLALSTGGDSGRYPTDETGKFNMSVALSALGKLATICNLINSDLCLLDKRRKKTGNSKKVAEK